MQDHLWREVASLQAALLVSRGLVCLEQLRREGSTMGDLGAAILNTCVPASNRRAVQELGFNKLRFFEVRAPLASHDAYLPRAMRREQSA